MKQCKISGNSTTSRNPVLYYTKSEEYSVQSQSDIVPALSSLNRAWLCTYIQDMKVCVCVVSFSLNYPNTATKLEGLVCAAV